MNRDDIQKISADLDYSTVLQQLALKNYQILSAAFNESQKVHDLLKDMLIRQEIATSRIIIKIDQLSEQIESIKKQLAGTMPILSRKRRKIVQILPGISTNAQSNLGAPGAKGAPKFNLLDVAENLTFQETEPKPESEPPTEAEPTPQSVPESIPEPETGTEQKPELKPELKPEVGAVENKTSSDIQTKKRASENRINHQGDLYEITWRLGRNGKTITVYGLSKLFSVWKNSRPRPTAAALAECLKHNKVKTYKKQQFRYSHTVQSLLNWQVVSEAMDKEIRRAMIDEGCRIL